MSKSCYIAIFLMLMVFFVSAQAQPAVFSDSLGRRVLIPETPKRIVSLAPSITEILFFLKLGHRIVWVTKFSYFPEEAKRKAKIGVYTDINIERVITLKPDLAIATTDGNEKGDVEMLERAGVPVYIVHPRRVDHVLKTIERIGEICNVADLAKSLVGELRKRVQRITEKVKNAPKPLVLLVINIQPIITVNKSTIHHDIIQMAGGRNMAGDQKIAYPKLNMEEVIKQGPDVIIISSMERGGEFERAKKKWQQWSTLPAVQKGNVYLINSDLIDRPAPRIVQGLEEMARIIHPEISWDDVQ